MALPISPDFEKALDLAAAGASDAGDAFKSHVRALATRLCENATVRHLEGGELSGTGLRDACIISMDFSRQNRRHLCISVDARGRVHESGMIERSKASLSPAQILQQAKHSTSSLLFNGDSGAASRVAQAIMESNIWPDGLAAASYVYLGGSLEKARVESLSRAFADMYSQHIVRLVRPFYAKLDPVVHAAVTTLCPIQYARDSYNWIMAGGEAQLRRLQALESYPLLGLYAKSHGLDPPYEKTGKLRDGGITINDVAAVIDGAGQLGKAIKNYFGIPDWLVRHLRGLKVCDFLPLSQTAPLPQINLLEQLGPDHRPRTEDAYRFIDRLLIANRGGRDEHSVDKSDLDEHVAIGLRNDLKRVAWPGVLDCADAIVGHLNETGDYLSALEDFAEAQRLAPAENEDTKDEVKLRERITEVGVIPLIHASEHWHVHQLDLLSQLMASKKTVAGCQSWEPLIKTPFRHSGFVIKPLCTRKQVYEEGRKLSHCVAQYCEKAAAFKCALFSLQDATGKHLSTIEIGPSMSGKRLEIFQHKSYNNRTPGPGEHDAAKALLHALNEFNDRLKTKSEGEEQDGRLVSATALRQIMDGGLRVLEYGESAIKCMIDVSGMDEVRKRLLEGGSKALQRCFWDVAVQMHQSGLAQSPELYSQELRQAAAERGLTLRDELLQGYERSARDGAASVRGTVAHHAPGA